MKYYCPNCGTVTKLRSEFPDIPDLCERIDVGEPVPAGECHKCGALVHEAESEDRLTMEQRCKLARDVYVAVYESSESFNEQEVGADLAYLMGAILDSDSDVDGFVDWMENKPAIYSTLKAVFGPKEPLWKFIRL